MSKLLLHRVTGVSTALLSQPSTQYRMCFLQQWNTLTYRKKLLLTTAMRTIEQRAAEQKTALSYPSFTVLGHQLLQRCTGQSSATLKTQQRQHVARKKKKKWHKPATVDTNASCSEKGIEVNKDSLNNSMKSYKTEPNNSCKKFQLVSILVTDSQNKHRKAKKSRLLSLLQEKQKKKLADGAAAEWIFEENHVGQTIPCKDTVNSKYIPASGVDSDEGSKHDHVLNTEKSLAGNEPLKYSHNINLQVKKNKNFMLIPASGGSADTARKHYKGKTKKHGGKAAAAVDGFESEAVDKQLKAGNEYLTSHERIIQSSDGITPDNTADKLKAEETEETVHEKEHSSIKAKPLNISAPFRHDTLAEESSSIVDSLSIYEQRHRSFLKRQHLERASVGLVNKTLHVHTHKSLQEKSAAYVHMCIHNQMWTELKNFLYKDKLHLTLDAYNNILCAFSHQGFLSSEVEPVVARMKSQGIAPNFLTHVYRLRAVPLKYTENAKPSITAILAEMKGQGFAPEDILIRTRIKEETWSNIKQKIELVIADFTPHPAPITTQYAAPLMQQFINTHGKTTNGQTNSHQITYDKKTLKHLIEKQLKIEREMGMNVKSIIPDEPSTPAVTQAEAILRNHTQMWRNEIEAAYHNEVQCLKIRYANRTNVNLLPFLKAFTPSDISSVLLKLIQNIVVDGITSGLTLFELKLQLGKDLYRLYHSQERMASSHGQKLVDIYREYVDVLSKEQLQYATHRELWDNIMVKQYTGTKLMDEVPPWPNSLLLQLGGTMYNILLEAVKVDVHAFDESKDRHFVHAFYVVHRLRKDRTQTYIKFHPSIHSIYDKANINTLWFSAVELPSLIPPRPWSEYEDGGYIFMCEDMIKPVISPQSYKETMDVVPRTQLFPVFDAMNILSSVPWVINHSILDLAIKLFKEGGAPHLDIPKHECTMEDIPEYDKDLPIEERLSLIKKRNKLIKEKQEMYSLWCTMLYRLSIANTYKHSVFWLPQNLDFRGRFYPIPPHFNHMGGDLSRGIMKFARGKPLGEHGLDWLKVHLINLTGLKKRSSNAERLAYADEIMDNILDSAYKPLKGSLWWQEQEEPWQVLACCKEIAAALRSPDHMLYVSHFPVHQDGSCNGLQHYAALGRDQSGAESVNVASSSAPEDVYSDIVQQVELERMQDAEDGVVIAQKLKGFLGRKVLKQSIMTTVYGVTMYGAALQIKGQLKDIDFPDADVSEASRYLADKMFLCLDKRFTSAKKIQNWLTLLATAVTTTCNAPMQWVTPIGLPVTQPYHKKEQLKMKFHLLQAHKQSQQRHKLGHHKNKIKFIVDMPALMQQRNAFPPNYIHSLDATHMMLTAMQCYREGITYASVHDCFWTHACDVPAMNIACRDQFVALHESPLLEDLSEFCLHTYVKPLKDSGDATESVLDFLQTLFTSIPDKGTFDLSEVKRSTYFFS